MITLRKEENKTFKIMIQGKTTLKKHIIKFDYIIHLQTGPLLKVTWDNSVKLRQPWASSSRVTTG